MTSYPPPASASYRERSNVDQCGSSSKGRVTIRPTIVVRLRTWNRISSELPLQVV